MPTALISRNSICPCGSGLRYKNCCGIVGRNAPLSSVPTRPEWSHLSASEADELKELMQQALAAQATGHPESAKALYEKVLARVPDTFDASHMLGVIYYRAGDFHHAFLYIRKALEDSDWRFKEMRHNLGLVVEALLTLCGNAYAKCAPPRPQHELPDLHNEEPLQTHSLPRRLPEGNAVPEITAIVSTYASEAFIAECLEDLVSQTVFDRMEIIVVDANSPENEKGIVEKFQRDYHNIRYIRTNDRITIYAAWNLAIRASRGKYITTFSTNDRLSPEAYAILANALDKHPEVQLAYGDSILTKIPHESFAKHTASGYLQWNPYSYEDLLTACRVGPHPMWRRSLHDAVGYFDEQYTAFGDQEFWLRLGEKYLLLHVPKATGLYWDTEDALSKKGEAPARELAAIRKTYETRYENDLKEWVRRTRLTSELDRLEAMFVARFGYLPNGLLSRSAMADAENGGVAASPQQTGLARFVADRAGPLISVLVSTYNSANLLRACLEDLEQQTIAEVCEIIVIDSGSEQGERDIVKEFESRFKNIVYVRTGRETLYAAWNRGIQLARGKYVTNANTDDAHRKDALQKLVAALEAFPEADVAYADYAWSSVANDSFENPQITRTVKHPPYHPADGMFYCFLGCHPMWRRTVFDQMGPFNPDLSAVADYEFFLRLIANRRRMVHVPEVLSLFYQNPRGLSLQSDRASREFSMVQRRYRAEMPLQHLFDIDAASPPEVARAWSALGVRATSVDVPFHDNPYVDLGYATFCFEQALQVGGENLTALCNLAAVYAYANNWGVARVLLERIPGEQSEILENLLRERKYAFKADPVLAAVEPLEFPPPCAH